MGQKVEHSFDASNKKILLSVVRMALRNTVFLWLPLVIVSMVINSVVIPKHIQIPYSVFLMVVVLGFPSIVFLRIFVFAIQPEAFYYRVTISRNSVSLDTSSGSKSMIWADVGSAKKEKRGWLFRSKGNMQLEILDSFFEEEQVEKMHALISGHHELTHGK